MIEKYSSVIFDDSIKGTVMKWNLKYLTPKPVETNKEVYIAILADLVKTGVLSFDRSLSHSHLTMLAFFDKYKDQFVGLRGSVKSLSFVRNCLSNSDICIINDIVELVQPTIVRLDYNNLQYDDDMIDVYAKLVRTDSLLYVCVAGNSFPDFVGTFGTSLYVKDPIFINKVIFMERLQLDDVKWRSFYGLSGTDPKLADRIYNTHVDGYEYIDSLAWCLK
jgi:hypothetical protein